MAGRLRWSRRRPAARVGIQWLPDVARSVAGSPDPASGLAATAREARRLLAADRVVAWIASPPGAPASTVDPDGGEAPSEQDFARLADLVHGPLHLTAEEIAAHPVWPIALGEAPVGGLVAAPLGAGGGVLLAVGRRGAPFDDDDEVVMGTLAALASLALDLVTQRARADAADDRMARLLRDSPLAIGIHGPGGVEFANEEAHRLLGFSPGGLVGQSTVDPAWDLIREDGTPLPVDDLPGLRARATGKPVIGVIGLRNRSTRERRFGLVAAHPLAVETGEIVSIGADITERVHARLLHDRQRGILTAIAEGGPIAEVAERICRSVDELVEGAQSALLVREHERLRLFAAPSLPDAARLPIESVPVGRDGGPAGLAAQWGDAVVVADLARDPAWQHLLDVPLGRGWRAMWVKPFRRSDDSVLGALVVHHTSERAPTGPEWEVVEALTGLAGIAIEADRAQHDLRVSREEAEAASERLRALIEAAPLAIFEIDLAGNVRLWNRAAEQTFGWRREEVLGHPPPIIPASDNGAYLDIQARVARGETLRDVELVRQRKDGSTVAVALAAAPLFDEQGEVHGGLAMMADISDRRRLEEQLLRAQRMEAVGRLAGGIAHDFNNLLTAIRGHVEFLMEDAVGEATLQDLEAVRLAASRGAKLTAQLLAVGRRQLVRPEIVDVGDILDTMRPLLERLLGEHVDVTIEAPPGGAGVRIDPVQLEQVLLNLGVNARDAMPNGGRFTVDVRHADLDRRAAPPDLDPGSYVVIEVTDTGEGMDAETLAQAFEPFFSTKAPHRGTGLGLAAVYGIVAQAGGQIGARSAPGQGTTFTIHLPRVDLPETARRDAETEPAAVGGHETVLLVEDEPPVRAVGRKVLERHGYRVIEAGDGEEALRVAAGHEGGIDLLVSDMVLPRLGGLDLARRLSKEIGGLRVLLVSGYTDELPAEGVADLPMMAFLAKPFGPTELARKVREVLDAPSA